MACVALPSDGEIPPLQRGARFKDAVEQDQEVRVNITCSMTMHDVSSLPGNSR